MPTRCIKCLKLVYDYIEHVLQVMDAYECQNTNICTQELAGMGPENTGYYSMYMTNVDLRLHFQWY